MPLTVLSQSFLLIQFVKASFYQRKHKEHKVQLRSIMMIIIILIMIIFIIFITLLQSVNSSVSFVCRTTL